MTKHTALHARHRELGASFTDFGGWDMPLKYGSELAEHRAVREAAGLFDLSHMGEVWVSGPDAAAFLNTALVGNLAVVRVGKAKYSLICDERGGIIDDLIVYRIAGGEETDEAPGAESRYLVVPNAGNAPVVAAALAERAVGFDVEIVDASAETSLIAVQGPAAEGILHGLVADGAHGDASRTAVTELPYYAWAAITVPGAGAGGQAEDAIDILLARTGYTGEDGFELFLPNDRAAEVWDRLLEIGGPAGLIPCGLAARDSLRLEAGMPLYGNELSLDTDPFQAGLGPVVSLKKSEQFIGRAALEAVKEAGPSRVLVGLKGLARRAGRGGYPVHAQAADGSGREIGRITSGQPSPTLGYPVALAYVEPAFSEIGTRVSVDLRGKPEPFEVVALPFYRRTT
ncbi:glycine cleavage system aminomethyltransferase GcvT [Leucobacter soli]|uniref:Aminomethyltransferase n=1 Tax=Leucobacter soli TaxID=2812850 RepID=A0A916JWS6_9MICO|nr:glycine cleavage system aminomethyltransferase GcvT [Leucobacter soli]CAG7611485.1 Aminomethyltransferase [Leucobacter soli]